MKNHAARPSSITLYQSKDCAESPAPSDAGDSAQQLINQRFTNLLSGNAGTEGVQTHVDLFVTAVDLLDVADDTGALR